MIHITLIKLMLITIQYREVGTVYEKEPYEENICLQTYF